MPNKERAVARLLMLSVGAWIALAGAGNVFGADVGKGSRHPLDLNENHPYGRLTSEYVTPHVTWGNPYFAGKLRALVLAPTWSQRETVELAQRLSLDCTPWMATNFMEIIAPASPDLAFSFWQPPPGVVNKVLREALEKDYDVMVIGKLNWAMLPGKQRFDLLKKVSEGTGLVYINPPRPHKELEIILEKSAGAAAGAFILDGVPLAQLPALRVIPGEKLLKTAQFGKGRVVVLDYGEKVPTEEWGSAAWPCLTPAWDTTSYTKVADGPAPVDKLPEVQWVPYEYYQSLVAKAVVWAAGRDSPLQVQMDLPANLAWPLNGKSVNITTVNATAKVVLRATVRDRYDPAKVFPLSLTKSRRDRGTFALAELPCGDYFLDVWVLTPDGKTTQTWSSRFFTVTDEFVFGELSLKNGIINAGDRLEGTLVLPRALKADEQLFLDLSDNFGRRILTQAVASPAASTAFTMIMPPPLTTLHRIDARLMRGARTVALKSTRFPVRCRRGWDDFLEVEWAGGGANSLISHRSAQKLVEHDEGDAIYACLAAAIGRNIALANALCLSASDRWGCFSGTADHLVIPPSTESGYGCMSQPATLRYLREWGEKQSAIMGPYGPLGWSNGDESHYSMDPDVCWCESCLEVFRNYVQSEYPDLAALNTEWKTAYANWNEVKPLTLKEARVKGVYAPWVEHCLANDRIFENFYRKCSETLATHDPDIRAGFDGCSNGFNSPNGGIDWWRLSRSVGIMQDYICNEEGTELIRSFGRPDQLRGQWYGTYGLTFQIGPNTVPYCHFFPWNSIFHGMNSTWFWVMGSPGPISGYAPDLTSLPFFASRTEALRTIKSGIGKLLLNATRANDGIAVHFSEVSRITEVLYDPEARSRCEAYIRSMADVNRALENAGLQYQYLSYDQVADGELGKQGYKVFIMPHSRAVSDAECKAIREFVQNGGVVIADLLPAILNGHGTPQPKSLLADLFPSDKPMAVNAIGKGKTVLIGNLLEGYGYAAYANLQGWKFLGDQSRRLAELLEQAAEVRPAVRIDHQGDGPMPPTEITRFQRGSSQFVSLLRSFWMYDDAAYPATVTFPAESHVYDMINGKYLGLQKEITGEISNRAQLYALLPYRVHALQIHGPDKCVAGVAASFAIKVRPDGNAAASNHMFRVEVADPSGRNLRYYAVNALAENGRAEVTIPWALNDRPGTYTLAARDVISGVKTELRIKLRAVK